MTYSGKSNQRPTVTSVQGRSSSHCRRLSSWLTAIITCFLPLTATAQTTYFNFTQSEYNADITISADPTSNGAFSISSPGVFTPFDSANTAIVNLTEVITLLNSGTSVTINTGNISGTGAGNIGLGSALTWTGVSSSVFLNLNASHDVNISSALTATTGSFQFSAYDNVNIGGAMTTTTGNMTFLAGHNINLNSAASITTGDFTAIAGGFANMDAAITVVNGTTTIVSGAVPEMDGSLVPQVALLLGCLCLMFARPKLAC